MATQHFSEYPSPESARRISQQFWNSQPLYSEPPPVMFSEPPPRVRSRARTRFAKVLFLAVFLPTVALLLVALLLQ